MSDLQQAITAIKAGDKATGKKLLIEIIKVNPNNEAAWLWMTQAVNTNQERLKCLQNVLKINPNNEAAKKGLATIQQRQASQQPLKVEAPPKRIEPLPELEPALMPSPSQLPTFDLTEHRAELRERQVPSLPHLPLKSLKQEATKRCPYCAETIKAEAIICRFCGKNISIEQQCPSCGTSVSAGSNFCPNCRTRIVTGTPIPVQLPPAQSHLSQGIRETGLTDKTVIVSEMGLLEEKITLAENRLRQYEREFDEAKNYDKNSGWGVIIGFGLAVVGNFLFGGVFFGLIGLGFGFLALLANFIWSHKKNDSLPLES